MSKNPAKRTTSRAYTKRPSKAAVTKQVGARAGTQGVSLKPVPPSGAGKQLRGIDLRSPAELDGMQLASWIRQAAKLPGMGS